MTENDLGAIFPLNKYTYLYSTNISALHCDFIDQTEMSLVIV